MPGDSLPSFSINELLSLDKAGHLFFYMVLCLLLALGAYKQYAYKWLRYNARTLAFATAATYGIVMELAQLIFFQSRFFDYFDILANIIGCIAGTILFTAVYYKI